MFDPERKKDAEDRYKRFEKLFKAQGRLWELLEPLLDQGKAQLRKGDERDLSLLVGAAFGKALKTFEGVHNLCLMGWGEDAVILVRANINLLINLAYILSDDNPGERAADFISHSYVERVKYLKNAHGVPAPWKPKYSDEDLQARAKRWKDIGIKQRAERVPKFPMFHYTQGYAFYSSMEHSDAMALNGYIAEWNEVGPRINAGPGDDYVEVALGHNAVTLADIVMLYCAHFKIERPDILKDIRELVQSIGE